MARRNQGTWDVGCREWTCHNLVPMSRHLCVHVAWFLEFALGVSVVSAPPCRCLTSVKINHDTLFLVIIPCWVKILLLVILVCYLSLPMKRICLSRDTSESVVLYQRLRSGHENMRSNECRTVLAGIQLSAEARPPSHGNYITAAAPLFKGQQCGHSNINGSPSLNTKIQIMDTEVSTH